MRQLGAEEKAALLLPMDDDDDDNEAAILPHDHFPVIARRPKTYHHSHGPHPMLCFTLILFAFILGCVSGVVIMLYRMGQDAEQNPPTSSMVMTVDLSIQKKLFQAITKEKFESFGNENGNEIDRANELVAQWKSLAPELSRTKKFSYDLELSKSISAKQWSGIELTHLNLSRNDRYSATDFRSLSSLIRSETFESQTIYYVNYGREEDFAYLFRFRILYANMNQSIVLMRRHPAVISQIEQIRQAIHYGFGGLILFDDPDNQQITTTNDRHSFFAEWARYFTENDREKYLDGILNGQGQSIPLLVLSMNDIRKMFESFRPDSDPWLPCPLEWSNQSTPLKVGGVLKNFKIRFVTNVENTKIELPVVMSSIRGDFEPDRFVMIGSRLTSPQQNRIFNELIQTYVTQMKNGWKPRRSILFCAWSGADYDQYPARRWLMDNARLINNNLVSYIDLGNGILSNSTLNLHGSALLEQVAHHAADAVPSPLQHDHNCHHRQMMTTMATEEDHHHDHGKRRRRDGGHDHHMEMREEAKEECEPHKLLDEWIRASRNRLGTNGTFPIVQTIDADSTAALFQLQYGIPSILIEMTKEQALDNNTFYVHHAIPISDPTIRAEVYVAYTQFLSEFIRQLIDEPLVPFNLSDYAKQIDGHVIQYLAHYDQAYYSLSYHLGSREEFSEIFKNLTNKMREIQSRIDQTPRNDLIGLQSFNKKLIDFERLLISNDQLPGMNSPDKIFKHVLIGPAFGLTHTVVPIPFLSNILYDIPGDPPGELCDGSKVFWSKLKEHISSINRILNGIDGLLSKK